MQEKMNRNIRIDVFVRLLWDRYCKEKGKQQIQELLQYGYRKGWLETQDIMQPQRLLERREAARIIHQFLKLELGEKDEEEWDVAKELQDLYDCRVCVNHVAQVYCKGIMSSGETPDGKKIFGMHQYLEKEEGLVIINRIFSIHDRKRMTGQTKRADQRAKKITFHEAKRLMQQFRQDKKEVQLIDVRTEIEYTAGHLAGAVHCSMSQILGNGFLFHDKTAIYFFYCDQAYQSEVAANFLFEHGYENVYYFGSQTE